MKIPENVRFITSTSSIYRLGKRVGDKIPVAWSTSDGHLTPGVVDYHANAVESYIREGAWRIVEDKSEAIPLLDKIKAFVKETDSGVIFCKHINWQVLVDNGEAYNADTDEGLLKIMEAVTLLHAAGAIK